MKEPARVRAPELPANLDWFNTDAPLRLARQRGRVVLLYFWTYSSVNCMHLLPDLHYLQSRYPRNLTVIGIHSPKFDNERRGPQVQKAINRHHIRHPVASDPDFHLWRAYGIKAWPSMILIDPAGFLLGVLRGEGRRQQLDQLIGAQITEAEKRGLLVDSALAVSPRSEPRSALRFPGKVLATANSLYIADSGRNRILHTYHDGTIRRVFGSGTAGLLDGPEMEAMFNNPQGMVIVGDFLYIADTGNHAIRRVHLKSGEVMTAAGTGEQGRYAADDYREPLQARLNSPWDLTYHESNLYIAMAGQHQIWRMNLNHLGIERYAGSGREDIVDGPRSQACFAQPSAVAAHNNDLYVLDAQASAVRSIWLNGNSVNSLAGAGLFDFGDRDGVGRDARLQHPLGLAVDPQRNSLWIADTFNSKIKRMDLRTRKLTSCNFSHALNEPHGVSLHGNRLFIANTNAHQVVAVDLQTQRTGVVDVREP